MFLIIGKTFIGIIIGIIVIGLAYEFPEIIFGILITCLWLFLGYFIGNFVF